MHFDFIPEINESLKKTKKAIITLGCSFVEGHGAVAQKLWDQYYVPGGKTDATDWDLTEQDAKHIMDEFPDITLSEYSEHRTKLKFYKHESNNAFGNVLCRKYFNGEYTCLNFGRRGNGNRAAIKDIYFYPGINWDEIQETIVIYCPSGAERYDFIDDQSCFVDKHGRWVTIWPTVVEPGSPRSLIGEGLKLGIATQRAIILEQIANIQELITWCKYKKAKLVIVPAFMRYYNRKRFFDFLHMNVLRKLDRTYEDEVPHDNESHIQQVVDLWPWENMFYPNGYPTFADFVMGQEKSLDWENGPNFYSYSGKGTPDKWITPCAHPSVKGHDLFASVLYKHLQEIL